MTKDFVVDLAAPSARSGGHGARRGRFETVHALTLGAAIAIGTASTADAGLTRKFPLIRAEQAALADWGQPRWLPRKKVLRKRVEQTKKELPPKPPKGPLILAISIADQRLKVYDAGVPIAEAPLSTGTKGHPTPTGVFSVIQKHKWHRSNIYSGAPMPYMQRITWSGVALHAGVLPGYPASPGCIRMPHEFAVRLWGMTRIGARVIVARNNVAPVEIAHSRLFELKKKPADPPDASADLPAVKTAAASTPLTDAVTVVASAADAAKTTNRPPGDEPSKVSNPGESPKAVDGVNPAATVAPKPPPLRPGPVSVFVSKKEGKLFVRKGFEPLFDAPVTIARPELPLGTHLYTATEFKDDGVAMRWVAVSLPAPPPKAEQHPNVSHSKSRTVRAEKPVTVAHDSQPPPTAAEALDRIELPQEAVERISELLSPGASLIVSDQGLGPETGRETDFIVLSR